MGPPTVDTVIMHAVIYTSECKHCGASLSEWQLFILSLSRSRRYLERFFKDRTFHFLNGKINVVHKNYRGHVTDYITVGGAN